MYASVDEFFYESVGGLSVASDAVGADHLIYFPQFSTASSASVSYETVRGTAALSWRQVPGQAAQVNITVPLNTRADVLLPEEMLVLWKREEETVVMKREAKALLLGSGVYLLELIA